MRQSWMNHACTCIAISPLLFKYRLLRSVLVGVSCLETSTPATICEFINWLLVIYFHYCLISDFLWELDIGQRAAGYVQHCYLSVICIYLHTCTLISLNRNHRYYIYAETYTPTIHNEVLLATRSISSSF